MKDAQCFRCKKMFNKKDIYTIQQFQYRKVPDYQWTKNFLHSQIGEWDSLCENCVKYFAGISLERWNNEKK